MFHSLYTQLSFVALFGCCGLALWKGGPAERGGGLLILVTWLGAMVGLAMAKQAYVLPTLFLASDAVLAAGLLVLALRHSSWWMGAAMLLQATGLSLHALYFAADKTEVHGHNLVLYVEGKNLASIAMLLVVLFGTIAHWRKASRARAAERQKLRHAILPAEQVA